MWILLTCGVHRELVFDHRVRSCRSAQRVWIWWDKTVWCSSSTLKGDVVGLAWYGRFDLGGQGVRTQISQPATVFSLLAILGSDRWDGAWEVHTAVPSLAGRCFRCSEEPSCSEPRDYVRPGRRVPKLLMLVSRWSFPGVPLKLRWEHWISSVFVKQHVRVQRCPCDMRISFSELCAADYLSRNSINVAEMGKFQTDYSESEVHCSTS